MWQCDAPPWKGEVTNLHQSGFKVLGAAGGASLPAKAHFLYPGGEAPHENMHMGVEFTTPMFMAMLVVFT